MMATTRITPSVPTVNASNVQRETLHVSRKLYLTLKTFSSVPGKTATQEPRAIQPVMRIVETQMPGRPNGWRYGRCTSGCEYRSFKGARKIQRYDSSVVEIAMSSTI